MSLSKREYVLEQTVSVEVQSVGDSWRAVVWLDNGKDLAHSVEGPWNPRGGTKAWETYFVPVIVHEAAAIPSRPANDALPVPASLRPAASNASRAHDDSSGAWKAAQNACLLPFHYGSHLDKDLARKDVLYALSELLQFAALAEGQFLNLLHDRIEHELSFIGDENIREYHTIMLLNLKFVKTQLASHVENLSKTLNIMQNRDALDWPRCRGSPEQSKVAALLLADFEYLLERAEMLVRECEQGIETLANNSVLEESRRSTNMAEELKRLTILATIFIPLSFVCSFWGMNFRETGKDNLSVWVWFVSAAGISLLVLTMYRWKAVSRWLRKRRRTK
jgi:hypothetical protein